MARSALAPLVPAALALAAAASSACNGDERMSAVVITLDTTRADALGCFGGEGGDTPHLDGLAAQGLVYDFAHTTAPLTLVAHASMFTGLYPPRHTLRDNGIAPLPASAVTVAEAAREAGFQTAAFVGAVVLDAEFGLDQGFDVYDGPDKPPTRERENHLFSERRGSEVVDRALAWLRARNPERPLFLWVHLFDPHAPYAPPKRFETRRLERALYQGEVRAADQALGRLLSELDAQGLGDETLVLFLSDHGEAFEEHGEKRHGVHTWQTTLRVPWIVRYPDGHRAGERTDELVSVVDVAPTLADAMGLELGTGVDGVSLFRRAAPADRGVYFESYTGYLAFGYSNVTGWLDAGGKYVFSSQPLFFDLASDPHERTNRIGERDVSAYRAALAGLEALPTLERSDAGAIDDDVRAELQALGYAGVEGAEDLPGLLETVPRPSPFELSELHRRTIFAMDLANSGYDREAATRLVDVLRENPRSIVALDRLSGCLMRLGRHEEAIGFLRRLTELSPGLADAHYNLGVCLREEGRLAEAREPFERAAQLLPGEPMFQETAAEVLEELGRPDDAAPYRARLAERAG